MDEDQTNLFAEHNLALLEAEHLNDFSAAAKRWRHILSVGTYPDMTQAHLSLADQLASHGRFADSIREYETLTKSQPNLSEANRALAFLYALSGARDRALSMLSGASSGALFGEFPQRAKEDILRVLDKKPPRDLHWRILFRQYNTKRRAAQSKGGGEP